MKVNFSPIFADYTLSNWDFSAIKVNLRWEGSVTLNTGRSMWVVQALWICVGWEYIMASNKSQTCNGNNVSRATIVSSWPSDTTPSLTSHNQPLQDPTNFIVVLGSLIHPTGTLQPIPMSLSSTQSFQSPSPWAFSIPAHPAFHCHHILSSKHPLLMISMIFSIWCMKMRLQLGWNGVVNLLKRCVLCAMFYEPSTRTAAPLPPPWRCSGRVVQILVDHAIVLHHPDVVVFSDSSHIFPGPNNQCW